MVTGRRKPRITPSQQRKLISAFGDGLSARSTADRHNVNRNTVEAFYRKLRERLLQRVNWETIRQLNSTNISPKATMESIRLETAGSMSLVPATSQRYRVFDYHLVPRKLAIERRFQRQLHLNMPNSGKLSSKGLQVLEIDNVPSNRFVISGEKLERPEVSYFTQNAGL